MKQISSSAMRRAAKHADSWHGVLSEAHTIYEGKEHVPVAVLLPYAEYERLQETVEEYGDGCSNCGGRPDGFVIDHITYYECGHAFCEHCQSRLYRTYENRRTMWCSVCDVAIRSNAEIAVSEMQHGKS
jgi:PHD/YefM family antitoxin component YafN of YafNO toxin-antitoxin module